LQATVVTVAKRATKLLTVSRRNKRMETNRVTITRKTVSTENATIAVKRGIRKRIVTN
jgi:hypothetical protein